MVEFGSTSSRVARPRSREVSEVRKQTAVEHERQILKHTAEGVKVMPQEHISERMVEQCEE